jgi:hypothetical protein
MHKSRIPHLDNTSKKATTEWLANLHKQRMLFCLDENPKNIVHMSNGLPMFTDKEAVEISSIVDILFSKFGDKLHNMAFDILSKTFHTPAERQTIKTMYG